MNNSPELLFNPPPQGMEKLMDLALDLHWTWSHAGDDLWKIVDPVIWELTGNPWFLLQSITTARYHELMENPAFHKNYNQLIENWENYKNQTGWFRDKYPNELNNPVAYFSMEFGLGEALPLYAGGLGILAGDHLKTASDLNVPIIGVGLLYQEGYFSQVLDSNGMQLEIFPNSDPHNLPLQPARDDSGDWLKVTLELPGRTLLLKVWQAKLGKVTLYLLDSNTPVNSPSDRGITARLYEANKENRLLQEMILGICGWKALEAMGIDPPICHLNEGHAAFMIIERARRFMYRYQKSFPVALWATRAGNIFTTHTPVAAAFDTYNPELVTRYFQKYLPSLKISEKELLALGRESPENDTEPFNMAVLALKGSISINGVSKLHGRVSQNLFQPLYPRWPNHEVPVKHITNGIHTPSWDSAIADSLWTKVRGDKSWLDSLEQLTPAIQQISDSELWEFRTTQRLEMVGYIRERLTVQVKQHGASPDMILKAQNILDPNVLTLGFARRFTAYKRPNLLLYDKDRLKRILTNIEKPVQLIVAGKAHPQDTEGKFLIQEFIEFSKQPAISDHVIFLEDYDMHLAEHLVQGVDVWINTPRRPWEACGTSGMKVLVNGGLNLSELDGWWAEAYSSEVGWSIGDAREHANSNYDSTEATELYDTLERKIIPLFYNRDSHGIPSQWISKIRSSMALLTPLFSTNRMLREYVEQIYLPVSRIFADRVSDEARKAEELYNWHNSLQRSWSHIHFGNIEINESDNSWSFQVPVYIGEIDPSYIQVQIYAEPDKNNDFIPVIMNKSDKLPGTINGYIYTGSAPKSQPRENYTLRVIPHHPDAVVPLEAGHILWQH